jgi:hypothetical protein
MSAPKDSEPPESQGVLSKLPRTRPQRSSPRRAAAREAMAAAGAATVAADRSNGRPAARSSDRATRPPRRPAARGSAGSRRGRGASARAAGTAATAQPVPRQGFECEGDRASGPVQPPGGAELLASAAEIVGELTKAGLSTGERLLKDVLSRLPLS